MSAADVPDVPADDYDTLAEKIKKTAPIETCLVQHKEKNMDTERAERLKTFPSLSNMTEHPEYFTGDTTADLLMQKTTSADSSTTNDVPDIPDDAKKAFDALKRKHHSLLEEITSDRKRMLLSLYDGMADLCAASGLTFSDVLDRLRRIDEALS